MTIDRVSDVFAFVAKNAALTKAILLTEDEVPEILPEERKAIAAVLSHVRDSYVDLLEKCRDVWYARSDGDPDLRKVMETNWNRPSSIAQRRMVEQPLVVKSSYVAVAYFWIDEVSHRPGELTLVGELTTQVRKRDALRAVGSGVKNPLL